MATDKTKKRSLKKTETVRERASKSTAAPKPRRLRQAASSASKPFVSAHRLGQREYFLPLPDNRFGRFLNKRLKIFPRFFGNAWQEVRQVQWPGRKETLKLTLAVFMFATLFGIIIALTDYGLDKLFRKVLLK